MTHLACPCCSIGAYPACGPSCARRRKGLFYPLPSAEETVLWANSWSTTLKQWPEQMQSYESGLAAARTEPCHRLSGSVLLVVSFNCLTHWRFYLTWLDARDSADLYAAGPRCSLACTADGQCTGATPLDGNSANISLFPYLSGVHPEPQLRWKTCLLSTLERRCTAEKTCLHLQFGQRSMFCLSHVCNQNKVLQHSD